MTHGMEAEETGPGVTSGETLIGSSSDGKTSTPGLQSRSRSSQGEARRKTLATSIRSHFSGGEPHPENALLFDFLFCLG